MGIKMLELRDVSYHVDDDKGKDILNHINLKIEDRFTAISGPNGGGKSTLAKMIAGIIRPTEGQILLDGEDITGLSITDRAKKGISFAFQQPVRFKGITVLDLIRLASGEKVSVDGACKYLSEVGLFEQMHEQTQGSIVIISHQERILNIADRIVVIADGSITAEGSKEEILPQLLNGDAYCVHNKGGCIRG